MIQQILLAITFIYGPLYLISLTKIFDATLSQLFSSIIGTQKKHIIYKILQSWFFYFSLIYQAWFWLFKTI